jgi:hypothetical protein
MDYQAIFSALDAEIAKLERIRELLAQNGKVNDVISRTLGKRTAIKKTVKHVMSVEARARIAAAQKRRWAKTRRAAKKAAAAVAIPA